MKRNFIAAAGMAAMMAFTASCTGGGNQSASAEFFSPYQPTDLRLPAVPIVVNDPYLSVWSPYDHLTDGSTRHWTGEQKPLTGLLRVDGETYRFMGTARECMEALLPTAREAEWRAPHTTVRQTNNEWTKPDFNDHNWKEGRGAFGSDSRSTFIRSYWNGDNTDVYVRRTVELSSDDVAGELYLFYSHDDVFEVFINGIKILDTGNTWKRDQVLKIEGEAQAALHEGTNVIAAHCHNTYGGAELDYGIYRNVVANQLSMKQAEQKSVSVMATSTYYTFACGPVELDVVFTAPMLIDDYDLLSTPINYISYQVRPTDGAAHDVQFYVDATPEFAINKGNQPTETTVIEQGGVRYLKTGTIEQPILAKKGDGICIDWGYLYLPAINGNVGIGNYVATEQQFAASGTIDESESRIVSSKLSEMPALAYVHNFGKVTTPQSSFMMVGYDEVQDIEYLFKRYKAYWAHGGQVSIFDAFSKLSGNYSNIMKRCHDFDRTIYEDGIKSGNKEYAEILSASYRHVMAAHKLFVNDEGKLFFFSKENNSNGSVNTVDLTYPEAPLFLCYNPELQKAMMTSILDYAQSGRWVKPFAAHDMGTYPIADGQTYGGDMPLEESGNMLTLCATICEIESSPKYVEPYWDVLTLWADYLVENGQDPANQLCTDDFAGHWAHNCNLSVKAIMGILAYSRLANLRGDKETAQKYEETAKRMAQKWEEDARDGDDHYKLAFDRPDTWSQKYNMVWDKLWNTNIFPNDPMATEINYYLTKQNVYGLPLDCRRDYTKSDWIMWSAAMAKDKDTFLQFVAPLYKYINETESRVAISDWHDTKTGRYQAFIARSVIGGYWMKVLMDKMQH